jgi:predicted RNA-binding Zn-ribbon protein involved in translation (DUF1610 family)
MPIDYLTPLNCPNCGVDFRVKRVPKHLRRKTAGDGWYYKVIHVHDAENDNDHWECPDCGHTWPINKIGSAK